MVKARLLGNGTHRSVMRLLRLGTPSARNPRYARRRAASTQAILSRLHGNHREYSLRQLLLRLLGTLVVILTVTAAVLYAGFMVIWMHAPLPGVVGLTLALAVLPMGISWGLFKLAARSKP
jgi:small-conductance mechanosensitive channel